MFNSKNPQIFPLWQNSLLWTLLYVIAHLPVPYSTSEYEHTPVIWLPIGVAFAAFVASGPFGVFFLAVCLAISGCISAYLTDNSILMSVIMTFGDLLAGIIGAYYYRTRIEPASKLDLLRSIPLFLTVLVVLASALASLFAGISVTETGFSWFNIWAPWFGSMALGLLMVGRPLIMIGWPLFPSGFGFAQAESAALLLLATVVGGFFFLPPASANIAGLFWVQITIPLVILTVLRCGDTVAVTSMLIIGTMAAFATLSGIGPISALPGAKIDQLLWMQSLLAIASTVIIFISAAISDRKRARDHDRRQSAILVAIENSALDAIISIDHRGLILTANPAAERLFGYSEKELVGRNVKRLMPQHFRKHHDGYLSNYLTTGQRKIIGIGRVVSGERKDGSIFPMELSVGEATLEGERIFVGTVRDLSEVEREHKRVQELQADLFHVSRVSEMGHIAASLAHEVNQPLAAIMNYAQAAAETLKHPSSDARNAVDGILVKVMTQATRAAEIIRRLRAFIEKRDIEKRIESLNVLVEESLALALVGPAGRKVHLRFALCHDVPQVFVDRVQIQQVIVNLVRNAIDSMEGIEFPEMEIGSRIINSTVEVSIADTGRGVAPDVAVDLFSAFVTTKRIGMGVGLSICKAIMDEHGGKIGFRPLEPKGTIFYFSLPLAHSEFTDK